MKTAKLPNYKHILLSVMPTFACQNNCSYCYLGKLREEYIILSQKDYSKRLIELMDDNFVIDGVQMYGGNLEMRHVKSHVDGLINTTKSVIGVTPTIIGKGYDAPHAVSLNVERIDYFENLHYAETHKGTDVVVCALPTTMKEGAKDLLVSLRNCTGHVTIVQYHMSSLCEHNEFLSTPNKDYAEFMIGVLEEYVKGNYTFQLTVIEELEMCLNGLYDVDPISHLYISPRGQYGAVQYDKRMLERFRWFVDLQHWKQFCSFERNDRFNKCGDCENFDKCYAEHYTVNWYPKDVCCGLKPLVEWWKGNRGRFSHKINRQM